MKKSIKVIAGIAAATAVGVVAAGCEMESASADGFDPAKCIDGKAWVELLDAGIKEQGGGVTVDDVWLYRADEWNQVYFISGVLDIPMPKGSDKHTAYWTSNEKKPYEGLTMSADAMAAEFSGIGTLKEDRPNYLETDADKYADMCRDL